METILILFVMLLVFLIYFLFYGFFWQDCYFGCSPSGLVS